MKNLLALLSILLLLLAAQPVFAAFPVQPTETTMPAEVRKQAPAKMYPAAPAPMPMSEGTGDAFAITSFVTGLLGVPVVPIIFGALALGSPTRYKGLAIAGLVLGILYLLIIALLIVALGTM